MLAVAQTGKESAGAKRSGPEPPRTATLVSTFEAPVVQRKICPCGGGCPHCIAVQAKLTIGRVNDPFESEADVAADRVVRGETPVVRRKCACAGTCAGCRHEEGELRRKSAAGSSRPEAPSIVHDVLRAPGQPLDGATQTFMESRFGHDFSRVRVHTDSSAHQSARSVSALAYTAGSHVVFDQGQYNPGTPEGARLLAHELSHVIQQDGATELLQRHTRGSVRFDPEDTVESILVYTLGHKSATVWMKKNDGTIYPLTYAVTESSLESGRTYAGFKDAGGIHVKEKGKDYLLYIEGTPDPSKLHFPSTFDIEVVDRSGTSATDNSAYGGGSDPTATGSDAPGNLAGLRVEILSDAQFQAVTGKALTELPDRRYVPAGLVPQWKLGPNAGLSAAGSAMVITPAPDFFLPDGATGVLWNGEHMSDFVVVNGRIIARGFRAGLLRHGVRAFERFGPVRNLLLRIGGPRQIGPLSFDTGLGPAGISLNRGVSGSYANDFVFPYTPGAKALYNLNPQPGAADSLWESMQSAGPALKGQTYRYSEPLLNHPAFKYRVDANGCVMGTNNCITLPRELHEEALGGETMLLSEGQYRMDVVQGSMLNPGQPAADSPFPAEILKPGMAPNMDTYFDQPEEIFAGQGLGIKPTAGPMWASGAIGVIRAGGWAFMIYGAAKTTARIADATPEERPIVIGEEAGGWTGGFVGNVLGSALGGAFVCAETGYGAFFCALGFGIAGGALGSNLGVGAGHDLAQLMVDAGRLTPGQVLEGATMLLGNDQQKRTLRDWKETETGEPNPFGF